MKAVEKLVSDGPIWCIGVSKFGVEELKEAEKARSNECLACNQVLHHLGYIGIEKSILTYHAEPKMVMLGYLPFSNNDSLFSPSQNSISLQYITGNRYNDQNL